MSCSNNIPPMPRFLSCSQGIMTNKELQWQINQAIEDERYEWACECRDELKRRKQLLNKKKTTTK
jgi:hypothetical protein